MMTDKVQRIENVIPIRKLSFEKRKIKVRFSLKSRYRDYFSCKTKFHFESETESFSLNPLVFNTYYKEVKSFANVRTELGHRY